MDVNPKCYQLTIKLIEKHKVNRDDLCFAGLFRHFFPRGLINKSDIHDKNSNSSPSTSVLIRSPDDCD